MPKNDPPPPLASSVLASRALRQQELQQQQQQKPSAQDNTQRKRRTSSFLKRLSASNGPVASMKPSKSTSVLSSSTSTTTTSQESLKEKFTPGTDKTQPGNNIGRLQSVRLTLIASVSRRRARSPASQTEPDSKKRQKEKQPRNVSAASRPPPAPSTTARIKRSPVAATSGSAAATSSSAAAIPPPAACSPSPTSPPSPVHPSPQRNMPAAAMRQTGTDKASKTETNACNDLGGKNDSRSPSKLRGASVIQDGTTTRLSLYAQLTAASTSPSPSPLSFIGRQRPVSSFAGLSSAVRDEEEDYDSSDDDDSLCDDDLPIQRQQQSQEHRDAGCCWRRSTDLHQLQRPAALSSTLTTSATSTALSSSTTMHRPQSSLLSFSDGCSTASTSSMRSSSCCSSSSSVRTVSQTPSDILLDDSPPPKSPSVVSKLLRFHQKSVDSVMYHKQSQQRQQQQQQQQSPPTPVVSCSSIYPSLESRIRKSIGIAPPTRNQRLSQQHRLSSILIPTHPIPPHQDDLIPHTPSPSPLSPLPAPQRSLSTFSNDIMLPPRRQSGPARARTMFTTAKLDIQHKKEAKAISVWRHTVSQLLLQDASSDTSDAPTSSGDAAAKATSRTASMPIVRGVTIASAKDHALRKFITHELYTTERSYHQLLTLIYTRYMQPMVAATQASHPLVRAGDIPVLFRYLPELLALSEKVLACFEHHSTHLWRDVLPLQVGRIFQLLEQELVTFVKYAVHYQANTKAIRRACNNVLFLKIEQDSLTRKETNRMGISDYLIAPFQRVPRYCLLIKDLMKHTEKDDPQFNELDHALRLLTGLTYAMDHAQQR